VKGAAQEDLALRFLESHGLKLVARNFRCRGGELDLVMRDRETLVIAEVRKRGNAAFGTPAESVDRRKRARLVLAAQVFVMQHAQFARAPLRFDVVALDAAEKIEWLRAAFDGGDA
jgi:putative endonuclease